jgi:hypothetical protein
MQLNSFTARPPARVKLELTTTKHADAGTVTVDGRTYAVRLTQHAGHVRAALVPLLRTFDALLNHDVEQELIKAWIEFAKLD